jgi:spore maturation protein CgeB
MSYRFVRITNYYPQYLKSFYETHGNSAKLSYTDHYRALVNDSFESASSYSRALNKIDGVEAMDIISNADQLQAQWKNEYHLSDHVTPAEVIIEQLKRFKPDVVWIDDFKLVTPDWIQKLRSSVPSVRLLLGHICAPYNADVEEKLKQFDLVFSCIPCMVEELKAKRIIAHLLYHSFDEEILPLLKSQNDQPETQFLFSGSLYSGAGFHNSRMEYIEALLENKIPVSLYCNLESYGKVMSKRLFYIFMNLLKKVRLERISMQIPFLKNKLAYAKSPVKSYSQKLLNAAHPPVFGMNLFRLMAKSKIVFNNHGEIAGKCAGNIRMFEVTGAGACLVTDWKENIHELFVPGKEIVTYTSVSDCIEKVKWLINNPDECDRIAKAGQERTLRDHTVSVRTNYLHSVILDQLKKF